MNNRVVVWFSAGAASAVAAKIAISRFGDAVIVARVRLPNDEHPDNDRFCAEVETWIGKPIAILSSEKYASCEDVFRRERYISGPNGAACTKRLKRAVQRTFQQDGDRLVVGFTADEHDRIDALRDRWPDEHFEFVLFDAGITKDDCYKILLASGIEIPTMYKLGYEHNNCIGCVKGGMGYWNKIKKDFPTVFASRAKVEREIGFPILRSVWLDELPMNAGRTAKEPELECGLFCESYRDLVNARRVLGEANP